MAAINFLYRSQKNKSNLVVRLLYTVKHPDYFVVRKKKGEDTQEFFTDFVYGANTSFEVSKFYWSKQHKKKSKDIDIANEQTRVNNELNKIENHILRAFNLANPAEINKEWLQMQIDYYYNPPKLAKALPTELTKYIDFYVDYRKYEIKDTSRKKFNVIKHKMERFQKFRNRIILISEINDNFKKEFVEYYKNEKYSQNTMHRELVFIKTFCKHARFLGAETHSQLDGLRLDREKVEKIYLNFEELKKIEEIEKDKLSISLSNARDWLIISCYTGQRISDFMRFTNEMIRIEDGKKFLEFTQKKTGKIMTVPMHRKVLEMLQKREGMFPYSISDQKYNDYIKDVCEIAELTQMVWGSISKETLPKSGKFRKESGSYRKCDLVTSHIGRRSFATNFYGTIPTSLLIGVTGHGTEAMYLSYIGKSNKDLAVELSNYF
jgi:site-specific recombinase XerD